jgi:hypothetical protein
VLGAFLFTYSSRNPLEFQNTVSRVNNCPLSNYVFESPPKYEEITDKNPPVYEKAIQSKKQLTTDLFVVTADQPTCDNNESNVIVNINNENEVSKKSIWRKFKKLTLYFFIFITLFNIFVIFMMIIYHYFWPEFILPIFLSCVFLEFVGFYWYIGKKYETSINF